MSYSIMDDKELKIKSFGIKRQLGDLRVLDILDGYKKIFVDDPVQRFSNVWDLERQTKLIDSILKDMYIPSICVQMMSDGTYNIIDGKQRLTTVISFVKGEFKLSKNAKPIEVITVNGEKVYVDIAEKAFNELPRKFQHKIESYVFHIEIMEMDEETKNEVFYRLNNGVALKAFERSKALMSPDFLHWIQKVKQYKIFNYNTSVKKSDKNKPSTKNQEVALQCLLVLVYKGETGLGHKEIELISKNGVSEEQRKVFEEVAEYLEKLISYVPEKRIRSLLAKSKITALFRVGEIGLKNQISPHITAQWAEEFFAINWRKSGTPSASFKIKTSGSTASKDNVSSRIKIAINDYKRFLEEYFKNPHEETAVTAG